jgi:hypothetical protein
MMEMAVSSSRWRSARPATSYESLSSPSFLYSSTASFHKWVAIFTGAYFSIIDADLKLLKRSLPASFLKLSLRLCSSFSS